MFRIGDFSRIARVSARLLRYYDEIGLLKPAFVAGDSGYRYYSAAQLPELNRILVFKELGFSLEETARLMGQDLSTEDIKDLLQKRHNKVSQALRDNTRQLRLIETRLSQLQDDGAFSADGVLMRSEPAQRILSMRRRAASFKEAQSRIPGIVAQARTLLEKRSPGQMIAIAHAEEFEADDIDVELGFILTDQDQPDVPQDSELKIRELAAATRVVTAVRTGSPEQAHLVTGKIGTYIETNGLKLDGPARELFLQSFDPAHPESTVVEMQFPVTDHPGNTISFHGSAGSNPDM